MAEPLFVAYLLALLLLPSLVWWRRGLVTSLAISVLQLALVALVFYVMAIYHLLPDVSAGMPPAKGPMERIKRSQGDGQILILFFAIFPGLVALVGAGLAVALSAISAAWRAVWAGGRRGPNRNPPYDYDRVCACATIA